MKINTTEETNKNEMKYKQNQERLKKEISRIQSLNLTSKGSKRYLESLNISLEQSFEDWLRMEEGRQNITGVNLK